MIPPFDLAAASQAVDALLREFGQSAVPYMVQVTLWNHRHADELEDQPAFRREAATLAGARRSRRASGSICIAAPAAGA